MDNNNYSNKLTHPKWQKKRLEILQRDNFTCTLCSDTETELHIHHKEYIYGNDVWDYENSNFQTLCKYCHTLTELSKKQNESVIISVKMLDLQDNPIITAIIKDNQSGDLRVSISIIENNELREFFSMSDNKHNEIGKLLKQAKKII